ncbi:MAG: TIGR04283 family arsenosugar biosynthesis glycosyltransferase, partial [Burkholderiales bacterium]|nr:TIGR04283 family arsenosugar biosynthesis glycosyltransferase [Burkholderiales bacterium]
GGSRDATRALAVPLADRILESARGRARQMNAGAGSAHGEVLLFLHADTILPASADGAIARAAASGARWGRFDVRITGDSRLLAVVAASMNARSRLTGIATGDQAIFVRADELRVAGGFPEIPLMEDVALCKRLKRASRPACLRERVETSGRRWQRHGTLRTILLMWRLRMAYALGADPVRLARRYDVERTSA